MGLSTLCWTHVHPTLIPLKLSQEIVGGSYPGVYIEEIGVMLYGAHIGPMVKCFKEDIS